MYRTGKSFLINRMFIPQKTGFAVGPSINPCTKGLWIWSKPIVSLQEDGTTLNTLVIDTEGFGSGLDTDVNHDIKIFTLAILMSSFFVYNSTGVIDEAALNNLQFIINLSKFIELKANMSNKLTVNSDLEELSSYFPSFLWVLRDFSLQLIGDNKENLSPRDYLEKVLENQNYGVNMIENENKNRVRKLIKTFFKERDCYTLVKPFSGDGQGSDAEILRPEFIDQITVLKRRIQSKIKPKNFKGKLINGEMFVQIIKSYINAMNSGMVPNIESTWMNLCKSETSKAFEESEKIYESVIGEKLKLAVKNNQNFTAIHQDAKKKSLETFKKKSIGEVATEYEKMLKKKLKDKFDNLSKKGEDELKVNSGLTKANMTKILDSWYSLIEYKLKSKEYKSMSEIESEFKQIEQKINDNFSQFRLKNEIFLSYKFKTIYIACENFLNNSKTENLVLSNRITDLTALLQKDKNSAALKIDTEMSKLKLTNDQMKYENFEIKQQFYSLKENFNNLSKEKEQLNYTLNEKIISLSEELDKKSFELSLKLNLAEERRMQVEKKLQNEKNELEREKSLLEQRIEQYAKQIDDQAKRAQENLKDFQIQLKEQQVATSISSGKYESQLLELKRQLEEYKDKMLELESTLTKKENQFEMESTQLEEKIIALKYNVNDLEEKNTGLKNKLDQQKNMYEDRLREKESESSTKIHMLKLRMEENELQSRTTEEHLKGIIEKNENEIALLKQNVSLLESQLEEKISLLNDEKTQKEKVEEKLENKTYELNDQIRRNEELTSQFGEEKRNLEENFEKMKTNLTKEITQLTTKMIESDMKNKNEIEHLSTELRLLQRSYDDLKRDCDLAVLKNRSLAENINDLHEEYQSKLRALTREYEKRLDDKEVKHQNVLYEINKSTEDTILQLRAIFENDKSRMEDRLSKERENSEFKMNVLITEYESRLRVQENELREEIDVIENELKNQINNNQLIESTLTHKINLLEQKIETLENLLREAKENFNRYQESNSANFDNHLENVKKEREEFMNKIENLNYEMSDKNTEISNLTYKLQQLNQNLNEKEEILVRLRKNFENEKKDLIERGDQLKTKLEETNDTFLLQKADLQRENSLLKQQIEFLEQKSENLQGIIQTNQTKYEERLCKINN